MACKVISVINWKGGVGKTTLTYHLGTGLQRLNKAEREKYLGKADYPRVLLVDNDAQCSLSVSCLGDKHFEDLVYKHGHPTVMQLYNHYLVHEEDYGFTVKDCLVKQSVRAKENQVFSGIDLLPAHQSLIYTDMDIAVYEKANHRSSLLGSKVYKFQMLKHMLDSVKDDYDYIFIDCPPNLNFITLNAIYASDYYLIPTLLDKLSTYGISSITNKIDELHRDFYLSDPFYEAAELIGIVANCVTERNQAPKQTELNTLQNLQMEFADLVFTNYLTRGDGIPKAFEQGFPVYALADSKGNAGKQSELLLKILQEMLERI